MIGIRQIVSFGVRFLKFLLVNVILGWFADIVIFDRVNWAIDYLFSSENGTENGALSVEAEEPAGTSSGQYRQRGA